MKEKQLQLYYTIAVRHERGHTGRVWLEKEPTKEIERQARILARRCLCARCQAKESWLQSVREREGPSKAARRP